MRVNSRVQEIWLRLLDAVDSSPTTRIEGVEEGYYAVVREAADRTQSHVACDPEDFRSVKPFIPHLARTRAVYLIQRDAYGLAEIESLSDWAGPLGE